MRRFPRGFRPRCMLTPVESSLYLAPSAQGRGLGTTLMQALLAEARRTGHHVVLAPHLVRQRFFPRHVP